MKMWSMTFWYSGMEYSGWMKRWNSCLKSTKSGNIKAYLLAALYNVPATMDSYYRAEVNHDLYGC